MVSCRGRRIGIIRNACSFHIIKGLRVVRCAGLIMMRTLRMGHAVGESSLSCTLARHTNIGLIALDHDSIVESV